MPKNENLQILVDGDPFAYRAAFSCEEKINGVRVVVKEVQEAYDKIDELLETALETVLWEVTDDKYQIFLTGKGNFRKDIAVTREYKANRKQPKPVYLSDVRQHMIDNWKVIVSKDEDVVDVFGIWSNPESIVISIDKDMLQLACTHYNPHRRTWQTVEEFEGLRFFYKQILTGDSADNIQGIYGVGPKKAEKILADCKTEQDLYQECVRAYGGDEERVIENGKLLWLRREEEQIWQPPKFTDSDQD